VVFPPNKQETALRLSGAKCRALLVQLLVAAHHDIEGLAAEHDAVFQGIEFCGGRDQSGILAFDANLFFHANILPLVLEGAVRLVVSGHPRPAECYRETVADAEAGERFLLGLVRFDGANFEYKSGIEYEEVERHCGRQWRIKGLRI
jgi:hypothetical protein